MNIHPSMSCELRIIRGKNIHVKPKGVVFVRCYLHAGSKRRVRLDSQEIPSNSDSITWNQTFSLDCSGDRESMKCLQEGKLVFELRWRSTAAPFIGRIKGSRLIVRAEVPWRNIVNSETVMTLENGRVYDDIINPTALQISLELQEFWKRVNKERWDEGCCCIDGGCKSCVDYEFFLPLKLF